MALSTYSDLKQAIADHLDTDALTSYIDDFIDLAEERHKNEIRMREQITKLSITISSRYTSLPTGYLEAKTLRLLTNPVTPLGYVSIDQMNKLRSEGTGRPAYFTVHETIETDVSPDQAYSGEIIYYKELTALSSSNTSNALLTRSPACYLYASLVAASPFLMHDERIQVWESFYQNARDGLNRASARGRRIGEMVPRIVGATP